MKAIGSDTSLVITEDLYIMFALFFHEAASLCISALSKAYMLV